MLFVNVTTVVIIMAENKHERHIENCAGIRGFIYSFDTENLVNLKYEDDMPLVAYIDCEKSSLTDSCLNPEQKKYVSNFLCHHFCISFWLGISTRYNLLKFWSLIGKIYFYKLSKQISHKFCISKNFVSVIRLC